MIVGESAARKPPPKTNSEAEPHGPEPGTDTVGQLSPYLVVPSPVLRKRELDSPSRML